MGGPHLLSGAVGLQGALLAAGLRETCDVSPSERSFQLAASPT
jgi:hypothetical protein